MEINIPSDNPIFDWAKKAKELGVPIIPPRPVIPLDPNPTIAICGLCGIEMKQVMSYSCSRPGCPCFPQITC